MDVYHARHRIAGMASEGGGMWVSGVEAKGGRSHSGWSVTAGQDRKVFCFFPAEGIDRSRVKDYDMSNDREGSTGCVTEARRKEEILGFIFSKLCSPGADRRTKVLKMAMGVWKLTDRAIDAHADDEGLAGWRKRRGNTYGGLRQKNTNKLPADPSTKSGRASLFSDG